MTTSTMMLYALFLSSTLVGVTMAQDSANDKVHISSSLTKDGKPCSHNTSIKLPNANKCLVLVNASLDWASARDMCAGAGGSLYKIPSARLYSKPGLMDCLSAIDGSFYKGGSDFNDMWLNGISLWSPQFRWTNNSLVNKVEYCSNENPLNFNATISSEFITVEYCVSSCRDQGASYTVLDSRGVHPRCDCIFNLGTRYQIPCSTDAFVASDHSRYFIVPSREDSLIKVGSAETVSPNEIMCATVDDKTMQDREMKSDACVRQRPFLCELGADDECKKGSADRQCVGMECHFPCGAKCLKRVSYPRNWYAAKSHCSSLGGDLWNMNRMDDMSQVTQYLDGQSRYWIGASNHAWKFDASSQRTSGVNADKLHCAHMSRETTSGSTSASWVWGDADCGLKKTFLCEFEHHQFKASERGQNVSCPWSNTGGVTTIRPGSGSTSYFVAGDDDSFPVAAVIAGIIAGLILLTCLALTFAFCGKKHWRKVRERLAFIPYFNDNSHVVLGNSHEFENMSQVGHNRSHMSSVSEHGSQTGLVKGGYSPYMTGTTHADTSAVYSSKSLDRRHMESMGQRLADSQHYLASANNSMDERGFAASYSTMPPRQKAYMTLQGQMNIQDEAQLHAMRGSLRHKPELTLVTDNVDMNMTVNHASGGSGSGSVSGGGGRVVDGATYPVSEGGVILTFPERVQEAHMYTSSTMKHHI